MPGEHGWKNVVVACAILFALVFFAFYPKFWDVDYADTIRTAYWLWDGKFIEKNPLYQYRLFDTGNGSFVSPFEIGRMLITAPFVLVSWNAPFVLGLVFHLLGLVFFYKTLKRLGLDARYSLIYLFFPPLVIIAHKFWIGETVSATLVMAAAYFYLKETKTDSIIAGLLMGLSMWFRFTNFAIIAALIAAAIIRRKNNPFELAVGAAAAAIPSMILTYAMIGVPWGYMLIGYAQVNQISAINPVTFATTIAHYLALTILGLDPVASTGLMFLFPLTLLSVYMFKELKLELLLSMLFVTVLVTLSLFQADGRYLAPVMPLLVLSSAQAFDSFYRLKNLWIWPKKEHVIYGVALVFLLLMPLMLYVQSEKMAAKKSISDSIYSSTHEGALIVDTNETTSYFFLEKFGDRKLVTMNQAELEDKVLNTCWAKENGGIGNIYVSSLTLSIKHDFSIERFLSVNTLSFHLKPLAEYMKEKGIPDNTAKCG